MSAGASIEERLTALERQMEEMRHELERQRKEENWIEKISGTFEGDPDFGEIIRLGREFRQSQRPPELGDD